MRKNTYIFPKYFFIEFKLSRSQFKCTNLRNEKKKKEINEILRLKSNKKDSRLVTEVDHLNMHPLCYCVVGP